MNSKRTPWQRDFHRLRTLAAEVLKQVDHFDRNTAKGSDDTVRGVLVESRTREMGAIGKRLARRWERERARRAEDRSKAPEVTR